MTSSVSQLVGLILAMCSTGATFEANGADILHHSNVRGLSLGRNGNASRAGQPYSPERFSERRLGRPAGTVPRKATAAEVDTALRTLVTPMMGYYIANFYFGAGLLVEAKQFIAAVGDFVTGFPSAAEIELPAEGASAADTAEALLGIRRFDVVYVQVNSVGAFASQVLDKLPHEIILITGQYLLPQVKTTPARWLAQS